VACKKGEKLINLELSRHISEKYSNTNFLKIRPAGAEFFHADGQTDMANVRVAFRYLANTPKGLLAVATCSLQTETDLSEKISYLHLQGI
jgi:hypothetical protein